MIRRRALLPMAGLLTAALAGTAPARSAEQQLDDLSAPGAYQEAWQVGQLAARRNGGHGWLELTTSGSGAPSFVRNVRRFAPPLDLRGKFVKLWLRVDRLDQLAGIEIRLSSDGFASGFFAYTLPLYRDPEFSLLQPGTWIPVSFTLASARVEGAPERAAVDAVGLYVMDRAEGPVRVDWGGVALVDEPPEGVLSLTFDDGYDEHYGVAARGMARHGFAGTAYVMPDQIGKTGYMTLEELHALREEHGWDVASHHARPFTEMGGAELEDTILGIQRYLFRNGLGTGFAHLAFPLGKHDPDTVMPLARKYFQTARIAGGGSETLPPADPHKLRVFNVLDTTPPPVIGAAARRARENHEWLILMFHRLVERPGNALEYGTEDFDRAMREIQQSGVTVKTVDEVWRDLAAAGGPPMRAGFAVRPGGPDGGMREAPASAAPTP